MAVDGEEWLTDRNEQKLLKKVVTETEINEIKESLTAIVPKKTVEENVAMEIKEIKAEKAILENRLRSCINEFGEKTGCCPYNVDIRIDSMKGCGATWLGPEYIVTSVKVAIEI